MADTNRSSSLSETPAQKAGVSSFLVEPTAENLEAAAALLREGGLVAIPTETVYGLAADATQSKACEAIFAIKGRPLIDPLIVHVRDLAHAEEVAVFNQQARLLAAAFWPGALTFVLPKRDIIPGIVTAGRKTVAVRCPAHPVFQALARRTDRPLAAPSANPFGYISPTRAEHVLSSFPDNGLPIIDGGPCEIGLESTIIDLSRPASPILLRAGQVTRESLSETLGTRVGIVNPSCPDKVVAQRAPGMLHRHYSPRTPTRLCTSIDLCGTENQIARIFFQRPETPLHHPLGTFWLSEDGDPDEAARVLYDLLRKIDADTQWQEIQIEIPPNSPETEALHDRLRRAAAQ